MLAFARGLGFMSAMVALEVLYHHRHAGSPVYRIWRALENLLATPPATYHGLGVPWMLSMGLGVLLFIAAAGLWARLP